MLANGQALSEILRLIHFIYGCGKGSRKILVRRLQCIGLGLRQGEADCQGIRPVKFLDYGAIPVIIF